MKSWFFIGLLSCILRNRLNNHETSRGNASKSFYPLELSIKLIIRHRSLNCFRFVKDRTQHTLLYLALLMLTNSSDIETNPGPRTPKYPCQVCARAVTWKDRGVACDDCSKWYHVECLHLSTYMYNALASSSISWQCTACGMPNFSTSLFDSFVIDSSSNIFEHLTDSNISLSPGS